MEECEKTRILPHVTIRIHTDSKYVFDHWRNNTSDLTTNVDLWSRFWAVMSKPFHSTTLIKVAAHKTLEDVDEGTISLEQFLGNDMADKASKQAAQERAYPPSLAKRLRHNLHLVKTVQRRLVEINVHCCQWLHPSARANSKQVCAPKPKNCATSSPNPNTQI